MGLRLRFNLVLTCVFLIGLAVSGVVAYEMLQSQARAEVIRRAELLIEAAQAIRSYTVEQVRPNLAIAHDGHFLPQSVPAFAATETLGRLPAEYRDYIYKEATINPTNPRDRALDWEAELVQAFQRDDSLKSMTGERVSAGSRQLYIASPITITDEKCLTCHSTAAAAPASMILAYGDANGFGWQMNEIVGAQVVSVPMSVAVGEANRTFAIFMASHCLIFLVAFIILNLMLSRMIVRPITRMSASADAISTGDFSVPEFPEKTSDEVGRLGISFNRMRRSLAQAMKMIDE